MLGNHVRAGFLCRYFAWVALLPSLALGATVEQQARSARSVVVAACRNGDEARVAPALARRLHVPEARLRKALRRLNNTGEAPKRLCDLTVEDLEQILTDAARSNEGKSESRDEWMRFTIGDEKGSIPPGGLARALEQRKALVRQSAGVLRPESNLAALPSSPAGWTNVTGYEHPVGSINALLIHPTSTNTMWAGADGGGIWKTTDGGTTWQAADDFLASLSVSSFAMRPGDPSTIYAATGAQGSHTGMGGAGVFKSTDGGTHWTPLPATDPASNVDWQYTYQLAIHPTDSTTVIAATYGGAYITTTGGTSWTKISATTTLVRNVAIHPSNGNLRVIAMDNGTVKIATDGSTYYPYTIATVTGSSFTRIALAPSNQNIMYALLNNGGTTQIYRSSTMGTSWTPVTPPSPTFFRGFLSYTGGLWVDPTNPNHIAVGELWSAVTSDASLPSPTWSSLCCGWADFHGMLSHPGYNGSSNKIVFFFDDGGLYRWADVDTVATTQPSYLTPNGITVSEVYSVAGRGGNLIFGAQDVGARIFMTTASDSTQKWRFTSFPYTFTRLYGDGATAAADRTSSNILYGSLQHLTLQRSLDGGSTSQLICQGITDINCDPIAHPDLLEVGNNSAFIAPFVLDPNNQSRMIAGASSLWRSNNVSSGNPPTWSVIHTNPGGCCVSAIAVAPTNSDVIWVAYTTGAVFKTANGTAPTPSWTQVTNVPAGNKLRIYIDRTSSSRVYIGLSGFLANRLVMTPDNAANWYPVSGLPSASVFAIQQHPNNSSWWYVGTAVGLFASADGGTTWSTTNEGPANVQVRDLNWYSETGASAVLLVGTFGRGIWRATLDSSVSLTAPTGLIATGASSMVCARPPDSTGASGVTDGSGIQPAIDWPPCSTSVSLTWNPVAGATYNIYRSSSLFSYAQVGTSAGPSYTDSASPGVAYLYMVRATDGSNESPNSNADLATTVGFSDATLTAGMPIRAVHMTDLRSAINLVRTLAALGSATLTDATLDSSVTVKRVHLTELRDALDAARATLGLPALTYTDSTITAQSTPIRAVHITELRDGVK
ncbi:MAG TPA: hypothetical protein VLV78_20990 [Thermoanaerobaculia bacterium]|nr:hypothetical protein [Thermoanaerobaculia bacterium]